MPAASYADAPQQDRVSRAAYIKLHVLTSAALLPTFDRAMCEHLANEQWETEAGQQAHHMSREDFLHSLTELGEMWVDTITNGDCKPSQITAFLTRLFHQITTQEVRSLSSTSATPSLSSSASSALPEKGGMAGGGMVNMNVCAKCLSASSPQPFCGPRTDVLFERLYHRPPVRTTYSTSASAAAPILSSDPELSDRLSMHSREDVAIRYLLAEPTEVVRLISPDAAAAADAAAGLESLGLADEARSQPRRCQTPSAMPVGIE